MHFLIIDDSDLFAKIELLSAKSLNRVFLDSVQTKTGQLGHSKRPFAIMIFRTKFSTMYEQNLPNFGIHFDVLREHELNNIIL